MIKLETTLNHLNDLFEALGTWQAVANQIGYNRATVNKWFAGTRVPDDLSREIVDLEHYNLVRKVRA